MLPLQFENSKEQVKYVRERNQYVIVHLPLSYYSIILVRIMYIMLNKNCSKVTAEHKYYLHYPSPPQFATLVRVKRFL